MDYILEATQSAMKDTIDQMDWDNIESIKDTLGKQFSILEYARSLELNDTPPRVTVSDNQTDTTDEDDATDAADEPDIYFFRKNLNGGYIEKKNPNDNVFLPEVLIRDHDLHDGDRLTYTMDDNRRYSVEVVDTSQRTETNIETFAYGIVTYDTAINRYVVEQNMNKEAIRLDDMPQRFLISPKDVLRFKISTDDVVDIAWYKGHFERGKVSWKHHTREHAPSEPTVSQRILNGKQDKPTKDKTKIKQDLEGCTVTLIGLEPYWGKFRQLITDRGGECITHCSKDPESSREASISKSDAVVVGISHTSHSASQHANKTCKEYGVPFASMNGFGGNTFLMEVYDKLDIA